MKATAAGCLLIVPILLFFTILSNQSVNAQCSPNYTYGVTSSGVIYPFSVSGNTITVGAAISNAPSSYYNANALGFNPSDNKFYVFTSDGTPWTNQFSSFLPGLLPPTTGAWTSVSSSGPGSTTVPSGAVSNDGKGFYCVDANAVLYYYSFAANTWTTITSTFKDQIGNDITSTMKTENSGDMAFDGNGNLWMVISSTSNYGLYEWKNPVTTAVASITLTQVIAPSTATPDASQINGIAFAPAGQIYLSTTNNNLYVLKNTTTAASLIGAVPGGIAFRDLASCNAPVSVLPVNFLDFTCTAAYSKVMLNWTAAQFGNTLEYQVQRSADGVQWETITTTASNYVNGVEKYSYADTHFLEGNNFYRIAEKDRDGHISYSDIRSVQLTSGATISLWPNPAKNTVHIQNKNSRTASVQIYTAQGHLVQTAAMLNGNTNINITSWPNGMYLVEIAQGNTSSTLQFLKN